MQQQVHHMVGGGIEPRQGKIEGQREHGKRVKVSLHRRRKDLPEVAQQFNGLRRGDIIAVVPVDKSCFKDRNKGSNGEYHADNGKQVKVVVIPGSRFYCRFMFSLWFVFLHSLCYFSCQYLLYPDLPGNFHQPAASCHSRLNVNLSKARALYGIIPGLVFMAVSFYKNSGSDLPKVII